MVVSAGRSLARDLFRDESVTPTSHLVRFCLFLAVVLALLVPAATAGAAPLRSPISILASGSLCVPAAAGALASMLIAAAPAEATVQCVPRPADPVGYQVSAVRADQVKPPATTPPIAVLDSGVSDVPELAGRLRRGANVTGGTRTDDLDGHGTAVATVAAGQAGGVRGVSPTSPVIPITILDQRGSTSVDWITEGIKRALSLGAGVINISVSGLANAAPPRENRRLQHAIDRAVTKGVPVIVPSGNEGISELDIPARDAHVIAVGATDESNVRAPFSNSGFGLDLVAPGVGIVSAAPPVICGSGYASVEGTSFSAPAVAGAAALLKAAHPAIDTTQLIDMLRLHGLRSAPPAWNPDTGFGLLDVPAVLAAPLPPRDAPEVDDHVAWAKLRPPVLTLSRRSVTVNARVATHTDPADFFRVRLKKGDRFRATLSSPGASLRLGFRNATKVIKTAKAGKLAMRIARTGTYYVSVRVVRTPPAGADYTLKLRR